MKIYSILFKSRSGSLVSIESETHQGFPTFSIYFQNPCFDRNSTAGRIRTAIRNQGLNFPKGCITTMIEPAIHIRSCGPLDAAIALSVLTAKDRSDRKVLVACKLSVTGECRPVEMDERKILEICTQNSISSVFLASGDGGKVQKNENGIQIFHTASLFEIAATVSAMSKQQSGSPQLQIDSCKPIVETFNPFDNVIGLDNAKEVLCIAAAGFHNILLDGPAGSGKSLLLSRFGKLIPNDCPEKTKHERDVNVSILQADRDTLISGNENMVSADRQMLGSMLSARNGSPPSIIAHHGKYLCIDEIAQIRECDLQALKSLCTKACVEKNGERYPAKIAIAAAINPCPCGRLGLSKSTCKCKQTSIEKHWKNLKNTLLGNFELSVCVGMADFEHEIAKDYSPVMEKIKTAREMQYQRYKNSDLLTYNGDIVRFGIDSEILKSAARHFPHCDSTREILILYSLARTLADMDGEDRIKNEHVEKSRMLYTNEPMNFF